MKNNCMLCQKTLYLNGSTKTKKERTNEIEGDCDKMVNTVIKY